MVDSAGLCEQPCISAKQHGVTEQGSHHWQNLNSTPAQLMLPATQHFAARRDVRHEKTSFIPVPSKAGRKYRSDFQKL
jgi:hypothetical protein